MGDCFKGTGKRTTEIRELASFDKILVQGNIDIIFTQGPVQEVKVEAGAKLIPLIKTEVDDSNKVHIRNDNRCNWARSYKKGNITVHITCPKLSLIKHFGSGFITNTDTFTVDTLEIFAIETGDLDMTVNANVIFTRNLGTTDITLHGKTFCLGNFHTGEGNHHCEDIRADYVWSYSKASGNEYYHPIKDLSATIQWDGDVFYKATNATTKRQGTGSGNLIRID